MEKFRERFLAVGFLTILFGLLLLHLLLPDAAVSYSERRKLAVPPEASADNLLSGKYFADAETYLLDHFPFREQFRTGKAVYTFYGLQARDNSGIYLHDGGVYQLEYPLRDDQVRYAAKLIETLSQTKLTENNRTFYAVIPDKNWFVAEENGYPSLDYERLFSLMRETLVKPKEIDLTGVLEVGDYYRTDPHWRQERLLPAAQRIAETLGVAIDPPDAYEPVTFGAFRGAYYGRSALPVQPDTLQYLLSDTLRDCTVASIEQEGVTTVYTPEAYDGMDGYDVFLSGAAALLTIENPHAATDRELVIFRDSFGSSLAPLLVSGYRTVTLIDLRYIASGALDAYITFDDQDVLFLYSTLILNSGAMLR